MFTAFSFAITNKVGLIYRTVFLKIITTIDFGDEMNAVTLLPVRLGV